MHRSLLLVFAHPDDESFGVAGTIARYTGQAVPVDLICATRGEEGTRLDIPENMETGDIREAEVRAAAAVTGIRAIYFLGYRDGKLAEADRHEVTGRVESIMSELHPEVVVTFGPDGITGHPDHIAIGDAATAAFRKLNARHGWPRKLYYVAIPENSLPEEIGQGVATRPCHDLTVVDISGYLDLKIRAIAAHRSQRDAQEFIAMLRGRAAETFARNEFFYLASARPAGKESDLFQ